jgi:hypothetical protein
MRVNLVAIVAGDDGGGSEDSAADDVDALAMSVNVGRDVMLAD